MKSELWFKCSCGKETLVMESNRGELALEFHPNKESLHRDRNATISFTCDCGKEVSLISMVTCGDEPCTNKRQTKE